MTIQIVKATIDWENAPLYIHKSFWESLESDYAARLWRQLTEDLGGEG